MQDNQTQTGNRVEMTPGGTSPFWLCAAHNENINFFGHERQLKERFIFDLIDCHYVEGTIAGTYEMKVTVTMQW